MVLEYFHGGGVIKATDDTTFFGGGKLKSSGVETDSSSLTSQFSCLKSKRTESDLADPLLNQIPKDHRYHKKRLIKDDDYHKNGSPFKSNRAEKEKNFTIFSIVWLILPVINLCVEITMDLIGVILFFVNEIFKTVYNMIVPPFLNIFGNDGSRAGKKHCFNLGWIRNFTLVLCPPAAIFLSTGLRGWLQIIICCLATLFYYFPGLAYAIIVIGRSDVNTYMKKFENKGKCDFDDGLINNFYISQKDNKPKCIRTAGETCSVDGVDLGGGQLDCCAQPELIKGEWKRGDKGAKDPDGNPINEYSEGELRCANDTNKIKMPKGICVFKSTNSP